MIGYQQVSRRDWYDIHGGFRNPSCIRRMYGGSWRYFIVGASK